MLNHCSAIAKSRAEFQKAFQLSNSQQWNALENLWNRTGESGERSSTKFGQDLELLNDLEIYSRKLSERSEFIRLTFPGRTEFIWETLKKI